MEGELESEQEWMLVAVDEGKDVAFRNSVLQILWVVARKYILFLQDFHRVHVTRIAPLYLRAQWAQQEVGEPVLSSGRLWVRAHTPA